MNRKILTRLLSVLLAAVMTFGLLPVSASAAWWWPWSKAETQPAKTTEQAVAVDTQAATDSSDFIRVFHLDCGRKYFTVDQVKEIIDELAKNHYTHLELAFGNEGLRFVLNEDNMKVGNYSGSEVVKAIAEGNKSYDNDQSLSYSVDAWTEAQMDTIITYANNKGIKIIPMFDIPGHMNAVIYAMQKLGISVSVFDYVGTTKPGNIGASFATNNTEAVTFATGLVENYIKYFSEKGCKYFNIAGDECGFDQMTSNQYDEYITLMNTLNAKVKAEGMITMMFNDGVYCTYPKTSNPTKKFDTDIVICYWTGGTNYATSPELAQKGFKLLNTNVHWYYVAGNEGGSADTSLFYYNYAINSLRNKKCTVCDGGGQETDFGCMLAFWCDNPTKNVNTTNLYTYIKTLADNNPNYFVAAPEFAITGATSLTVGATTRLTANETVRSWDVDGEAVTITATTDTTATVTALAAGEATITATSTSGKTATHKITVTDGSEIEVADTVPIEMTVGDEPYKVTQDGVNNKNKVTDSKLDTDIATVKVDGDDAKDDFKLATSITSGKSYYISDGNGNFLSLENGNLTNKTKQEEATQWTFSANSYTNYTIKSGNYYLYCSDGSLSVKTYSRAWNCGTNGAIYYNANYSNSYYLCYDNGWKVSNSIWHNSAYAYTGETKPASTSITFTPVAEGTTEVIVGTTKYVITVKAKETAVGVRLTPGDEYDLTNNIDIPADGTVAFEKVSASGVDVDEATGKLTNTVDGGSAAVKATVKTKAGRTAAIYTFTITVSKEDLSTAAKLPIQLWITNQTIQSDNSEETTGTFLSGWGDNVQYIALDASTIPGVNSSNGVALSACVPELITNRYQYNTTYWKSIHDNAGDENKIAYNFLLWKGKVLNSTTGLQLSGNGASMINATETGKINDFAFVRYLDGKWEVSPDQKQWREVTGSGSTGSSSTCTEQIIAYYYMQTKLTDEVTTNIVDWGNKYENYSSTAYVLLDFAVMLESGTRVPSLSEFPIKKRTLAYHCNGESDTCGTANGTAYRRIDQIEATKADDYEIYMITLTPSSDTCTTQLASNCQNNSAGSGIYKGTEKVIWVSSVEDLNKTDFADRSLWYSSPSGANAFDPTDTTGKYVGGAAELSSVEIYKNQGLLVTYYVRAKTENKITVHYIDKVNNKEFHTIELSVKKDTYFNAGFGMGDALNTLVNNTVTTVNNATETVQADLKQLPTVPAEYRRVTYKLVETALQPSNDAATDAYLYYEFDNNAVFVADFGLPLTIKPEEVNDNLKDATITNATATVSSGVPLTVNTDDNNNIVITPTAGFAAEKSGVTFTLEYTGRRSGSTAVATVAYRITIIPASNVLYEENFLTSADKTWTSAAVAHTVSQQTQSNDATKTYNVFGYDGAYAGSDNENGVWKATGLTTTAATGELTADFYGNAFDLIGNCGPTTGRVMLIIAKQGTHQGLKAAIVDTRYKTDIYQVPLAHLELSTEGAYTAYIYASGLDAVTASTQAAVYSAPALMSVNAADPVADVLAEYGLSSADVEYIGGDQIAASPIAVQRAPAIAAYADSTIERQAGDHVEIAGFRVYRSTAGTVAANYPAAEQNLTYKNILKVVDRAFVACTENESNFSATVETYENAGGPQNEIYLANNQSIVFGVSSPNAIQVSLRAVKNTTNWNNGSGTAAEIGSITEMYYNVTPVVQDDGTYTVTILNTGNDLLAIGNVKLPNNVTTQSTSELSDDVILASVRMAYAGAPEPAEETFKPDTFKVHVTSLPMFRSKIVTLGITVSKDVAYVTVNGRTYTPSKLFSRWLKTATIPVTETISRSETRTYTIIAYNSDGVASDPIEVRG